MDRRVVSWHLFLQYFPSAFVGFEGEGSDD